MRRASSPPLLRSVTLHRAGLADGQFPFSVPVVRALETLRFPTAITFLVGENGSGKSTLLEGIAAAARLPAVGSDSVEHDVTLGAARLLAKHLKLSWTKRTSRGFFLRAEDFFGFAKRIAQMRGELVREIGDASDAYRKEGRSVHALTLKAGPLRASLADMERRYGIDLDARSHGESFLALFQSRFVPDGLYLLDEPEAPLSPQNQIGLLAMLGDMVARGSQFIIATHSPIVLAFPGATIYSCDRAPIAEAKYAELEHVNLMRDFLVDPSRFLRLLGE